MESKAECGCRFHISHDPCEHHGQSLAAGDERVHVTLEFRTKYSHWPGNRHKVNLERVQRLHLGLDQEPMAFNEGTLADMVQAIADADPTGDAAFVLAALANALRGDDEHHRLRLQQAKRGKWQSPSDGVARHRQHCAWILRLDRLQRQGWQTDAAIHRIAETTGNSVSRVYAGIAEEREWQELLRTFPRFHSETGKLKRSKAARSPNNEF